MASLGRIRRHSYAGRKGQLNAGYITQQISRLMRRSSTRLLRDILVLEISQLIGAPRSPQNQDET